MVWGRIDWCGCADWLGERSGGDQRRPLGAMGSQSMVHVGSQDTQHSSHACGQERLWDWEEGAPEEGEQPTQRLQFEPGFDTLQGRPPGTRLFRHMLRR
jgi:hypothetical protein